MLPQQYCLRWKYHHSNLQTMFSQLLDRGCFCDVTLACEGQLIRAHRVVLSACSTFFDTVLTNYASERDPIIIMKDVTFADVKCLIEFMYKGEINVEHAHLASLLKTADDLKIKGLAEVSWRDDDDDRPPPPTPATEFHSPTRSVHDNNSRTYAAHEAHHHQRNGGGGTSSPGIEHEEHNEAESPRTQQTIRMPTLTPIPLASSGSGAVGNGISMGAALSSPVDHYLGPKRKRGRPPLDDTYDVFNVRKLAGHYAAHLEQHHQAYLESSHQYSDEHRPHAAASPAPTSSAAAVAAYQHHIHQQQSKQQRIRQRHQHHQQQPQQHQHQHQRQQRQSESDETEHDDVQTDPEWITSNLEVNVAESEQANGNAECGDLPDAEIKENKKTTTEAEVVENDITINKVDKRKREGKEKGKRKHSHEELHDDTGNVGNDLADTHEREQQTAKSRLILERDRDHEHKDEPATTVPQPVEDIESLQQQAQDRSGSPSIAATHHKSIVAAVTVVPPPPPPPLHHPHFSKYAPEGYLLNEHGMLMTHDFVHAPTASIPSASATAATSSGGSGGVGASNGSNDNDFIDIKMEDYDAAELRLTSEEMSQWQDVIKMDDYLAKGRRPQFWEEPFTRRVLDAIKNKRLEMKKAARILGVSYGTLYGRYREVYGCLKHPYSSTTFRPSQSNPLAVQPRFDIVWPSAKRDAAMLPGQLEIGKIRPKDLSELWSRPQI